MMRTRIVTVAVLATALTVSAALAQQQQPPGTQRVSGTIERLDGNTIYGKARAQVLKDNMETQIYHRTNDFFTAQYLQDRCGDKSGYARSTTLREGREGGVKSIGAAERGVPLVTAQEVMKLKDHEMIVFHRNLPPFKIRRVEWWRHPIFRHRRNMAAPALSWLPPVPEIPTQVQQQPFRFAQEYIDPDYASVPSGCIRREEVKYHEL